MDVNLHNIFRHLVGNDEFLLEIRAKKKTKASKKPTLGMMEMVSGNTLHPGERQTYEDLPETIQCLVTDKYERIGIQGNREVDGERLNCSFVTSLFLLLRPELYIESANIFEKEIENFEAFLIHTMQRNYRIDKTKNTKKVKIANQSMVDEIRRDCPYPETIRTVINIFEINLVIYDQNSGETSLYWTGGTRYPFFNCFKKLHFMIRSGNHYEPVIALGQKPTPKRQQRLYKRLVSRMVSPFSGGKERKSRSKEPGIGLFPYGKIQGDPREGFPIRIESLLYPSTWKDPTVFETLTPLLVPIEPPDETSK